MPNPGWKKLVAGHPWFQGPESYPIAAYSEFMPPPRLGLKPYGGVEPTLFTDDDPWGWRVSEYEEATQLQPGMALVAAELLRVLQHLGQGDPAHGISRKKLEGNPYWPAQLQERGAPAHERYVLLLPLALSRTQDDKGRVRWTLFGGSEQGPGRVFWRGFFQAPRRELPQAWSEDFVRRLLGGAYGEKPAALADLHRAGFRVFTSPQAALFPFWDEAPLPAWTDRYRWNEGQSLRGVRYLLTFCPFEFLPAGVRRAYLAGDLHLLPFPGSLVFYGAPPYVRLQRELPLAIQIPLLQSLYRHEAPVGLRVPQSGWLHEEHAGGTIHHEHYGPLRNTFRRTHRWQRIERHEDDLAVLATEDKLAHVLLSTAPDDVGLYGKPMARNAQIWSSDFELLLDGPQATADDLTRVARRLTEGGLFGYRMIYPAMRVGRHEVYWHRPLVAFPGAKGAAPTVLADAPLGYFTAYACARLQPDRPVELWPRLLKRPLVQAALRHFTHTRTHRYRQTLYNVRKLLQTQELLGRPLTPSFARQLLTIAKPETLEDWFRALPSHAEPAAEIGPIVARLRACIAPAGPPPIQAAAQPEPALTFQRTAKRSYEKAYWQTIARLSTGRYVNKDNADCALDPATQKRQAHCQRDLEALGDYLLAYYEKAAGAAGMAGQVLVGELPFRWQTDFSFNWWGGWRQNQEHGPAERDLVIVIPGRNRRRAIIMADHYDTAYMEDMYGYQNARHGPRMAAAGADDNHSATAAMMLAAPIFLDLAKAGRLESDIWLVHLTGEEFPADCMGARHLCQRVVQGDMEIRLTNGRRKSLAKTRVEGVFVMDMIAHNNQRDQDVFQISPGTSRQSMRLAEEAHAANEIWNASTPVWNRRAKRRGCGRGRRSADGATMPDVALHLPLRGEIRPAYHPRSSLFNTDGQIFSDAGVPVVLFMENYDINRKGYHDTHDTLENIDLDYGAALSAIAIETVARTAARKSLAD